MKPKIGKKFAAAAVPLVLFLSVLGLEVFAEEVDPAETDQAIEITQPENIQATETPDKLQLAEADLAESGNSGITFSEITIPNKETPAAPGSTFSYREYQATVYTDATMKELSPHEKLKISGNLPAGGYALAFPVETALAEDVLVAFDIKLYRADGSEIEFDGTLTVSIELPDMPIDLQESDLSVVYIPEEGKPETLETPVTMTKEGIAFEVEHFSVYAITITNINPTYNIVLDGTTIQTGRTATSYAGTVTSTAVGQVHYITFTSTNTNLTFTSIEQDGEELLTAPMPVAPSGTFSYTVEFSMSTTVYITYRNASNTYMTIALDMTVIPAHSDLEIINSILQDGLLTANLDFPIPPGGSVTYNWSRSPFSHGTFTPVHEQALSSDGASVNVAIDLGGLQWYQVEAAVDDGTGTITTYLSNPFMVPYSTEFRNGSFEYPTTLPANNGNFANVGNGTPLLIWRTTGQDSMVEICLRPSTYYLSAAADGIRFAELNANYVGTLYQDILVTPGETLHWSLAHAGRLGTDVMDVTVMPSGLVDSYTILPVNDVYDGEGNRIVQVKRVTSPSGKWTYHDSYDDGYIVPEGVYVLRLFFESISAAGGNKTQGNLLDNITFNSYLHYTVEYYLNGVLQDITETGRSAPDTIIAAQNTGVFSPHYLQQTTLNGKNAKHATSFALDVPNSVLRLYYVSSGLYANKTIEGIFPDDLANAAIPYEVTFFLYLGTENSGGGWIARASTTIDDSGTFSAQFMDANGDPFQPITNVPTTYTITESVSGEIPGYTFLATTSTVQDSTGANMVVGGVQGGTQVTFSTATTSAIYESYFTNAYGIGLNIHKVSEYGTSLAAAEFRLERSAGSSGIWDLVASGTGEATFTTDANGLIALATLANGLYRLEEISAPLGYKVVDPLYFAVLDGVVTITDASGASGSSAKVPDFAHAEKQGSEWYIHVVNPRADVNVPDLGLGEGADGLFFFIVVTFLAIGGGAFYLRRKRRE